MAEISCKHCDSPDCRGCNMYRLEQMLNAGKLDMLMNKNRAIQISADMRPVIHAQWIKCGDNQPMSCDNVYCCSNCKGNKRLEWHLKPFCEECGAKMDANEST